MTVLLRIACSYQVGLVICLDPKRNNPMCCPRDLSIGHRLAAKVGWPVFSAQQDTTENDLLHNSDLDSTPAVSANTACLQDIAGTLSCNIYNTNRNSKTFELVVCWKLHDYKLK